MLTAEWRWDVAALGRSTTQQAPRRGFAQALPQ
jgi:hypothetical protein